MNSNKRWIIRFNSPVVLTFVGLCIAVMCINTLTNGWLTMHLCSAHRGSLANPLTYLRSVLHVLGHGSWKDHLFPNMLYILLLGPMLEEKYSSKAVLLLILSTAVVTGTASMIFFPHVYLYGASGIVFAMILLSSITKAEDHSIPVTFLIVAILYLGMQVFDALKGEDGISQFAHILGGAVGAFTGFQKAKSANK